jgi:NADH-quinone oxidoreductase subunit D
LGKFKNYRTSLQNLPEGDFHADVPEFYLPEKAEVYNNMEALIYHFKIVMGETKFLKEKFTIV